MPIKIPADQIQNLQQLEAIVAGPDGANRLLTVIGQFDIAISVAAPVGNVGQNTAVFTALIGPVLTRQQFYKAIGSASVAKTQMTVSVLQAVCQISFNSFDADWDDESGQVQLTVEVGVLAFGQNNVASVNGITFQATILYMA